MLPGHLIELLLDLYSSSGAREPISIFSLSDDVLASILQRSLAAGFGGVLDEDGLAALATTMGLYDPWKCHADLHDPAPLSRTIFDLFQDRYEGRPVTYELFYRHFLRFVMELDHLLDQVSEPQLLDTPCRDFGEPDLNELSKIPVPEELSGYMISLATFLGSRGELDAADVLHVRDLIEKMACAPGYLRFLSKERKYQEAVWMFGLVRHLQSSCLVPGPVEDDMLVALGLLLYNISPSENVAAYLASIRPTNASSALQYHYNAVLALNHLLTGRLRRASAYAARARRMTADQGMASYIYILQGCIAIRQGDYGRAVALLDDAASTAPAGRMSALTAFYRGVVLFEKREYSRAIRCFECAGNSTADPLDKVVVHNNIGSCAMYLGDMRRAEEEFLAMEQLAWHLNRHLARKCLLTVSSYIGALSRARGENAKAIERYENSLKIAVSTGDEKVIANQMGNLGVAYASAGATVKAVQFLNSCMAYSERIGYWAGIRFACWHICHTLAGAGQRTEARRFHDSYVARYPELRYLRY